MRKLINWIRNFIQYIKEYPERMNRIERQLKLAVDTATTAEQVIRDRTDLSVDTAFHSQDPNIIFVAGRYKNRDWVELYSIRSEEFHEIIPMLRDMQRYASLRRLDAPLSYKGFIERELKI